MAGEQDARKIRFVGPPGVAKPFELARFSGTEGLSRLFEYEVELLSLDLEVKFETVIGKPAAIVIAADAHGPERLVHGFISRFGMIDRMVNHMRYTATLVPYLWFLDQTAECRIMPPNMTVPDIVRQVLSDKHFDDVDDSALDRSAYKPRPYCVQYRETDFNFVARLLEEEGIYYYFEHTREGDTPKHVMVLCDSSVEHPMGEKCDALHMAKQRNDSTNAIADWTVMNHVHADQAFIMDFDFETRDLLRVHGQAVYDKLANEQPEARFVPPVPGDLADYPAGFYKGMEGKDRERLAAVRAEQAAVRRTIHRGLTTAHGLFPGVTFKVSGHDRDDQNSTYLVISSSHEGWEALPETGGTSHDGEPYTVAFEAIDAKRHYRPPRTTSKPVIAGAQTALVVGNDKKEAFTDEYGRVRVKFHWDSSDEQGEKASCLIRVAQIWAGNRWGAMFMPRVGHEVVVEFLEGDPDRPLITGRVYNGMAKPPYDPQKHASVSTIKSMTNQEGRGFNELRFEDKKGSEQLFMHAQRRMDVRVGASLYETVGGSREEHIGSDDKGDLNILVSNDVNSHVKGGQYELVDKKLNQNVKAEVVQVYEDNHTISVSSRQTLNAKELAFEAEQTLSVKADKVTAQGAQALSLKAGSIKIEGTQSLTLKCGPTFLVLTPSGAFLNGPPINMNTGGGPQPADPPLVMQEPSLETPVDAEEATSALPGDHVAAGGAGAGRGGAAPKPRTRQTRKVPLKRAPEPPPPPPIGPKANTDPNKKLIDIKWVEKETYCGGPATLTGTTKNYADDEHEQAEIRNVTDGTTVATAPIAIRGNAFNQKVDVKDWMPRKSGDSFEEDRDEDAFAAGKKTPDPLKMKFIPNLDKAACSLASKTGVVARFDMLSKSYVCKVLGDITYVEGKMGELIQLGTSVPAGTGGSTGLNFGAANPNVMSGNDWRFTKPDPTAPSGRVFWDGKAWQPVPAAWRDAPGGTKLFGIGIYRDGTTNKGEYGLTWPDPIPDWTDAQRAQAKTIIDGWVANCASAWTNKFDLKRDGCSSSNQKCCRYSTEIAVSFTVMAAAKKAKGTIVIGINNARSNSESWSLGDNRPGLAPHEFGHHLGCPDEYAGAGSVDPSVNTDGATAGIDYTSMMGSVPATGMAPVKARSFDIIKQQLAAMISKQKSKTFTFTAVPHI